MTTNHLSEQFPRVWISKLFTGWSYGAQYTHAYRERKFPDDIEFIQLAEHHQIQAETREKLREIRKHLIDYDCRSKNADGGKCHVCEAVGVINELLGSSEDLMGKGGV